ncbi:small multi-drug export protein [candidate division WOR-3 bacterium]|nr:small multi-drug export protein [candidate division WOR-3 bacterium]
MKVNLITLLLSMAPISELRGAIPYAWSQGMGHWQAYGLSVIGNLIPVVPILLLLGPISNFLRRYKPFDTFFDWWFKYTLKRSKLIEKYEALGLILFVMIPLPITGAWTGSVAAFLLGVRFKFALPAIILGVLLAGMIVSLVCLGAVHIPIFIKQ